MLLFDRGLSWRTLVLTACSAAAVGLGSSTSASEASSITASSESSDTHPSAVPVALSQALRAGEPFGPPSPIRNSNSKRCIGVDDASTSPGKHIKQFECDGKANQQWILDIKEKREDGVLVFNLKNENSKMCMGVDDASKLSGASIRQFPCDGSENQKWHDQKNPAPDYVLLINEKSSKCIGVDRASREDEAQLKQFDCDKRPNQRWQ